MSQTLTHNEATNVPGQIPLTGMASTLGYDSIKLDPKYEKFCREYVLRNNNATQAYLAAYPTTSKPAAAVSAHKLLRKDNIIKRIEEYRAELRSKYSASVDDLIQYHSKVLKIDRREYLDNHGQLKKLDDIDSESASILEFEVVQGKMGGTKVILSVPQRHQSSVELGKILGANKDRLELTGKDGGAVELSTLGDVERAARVAALLNAARKERDRQVAAEQCAVVGTSAGATD